MRIRDQDRQGERPQHPFGGTFPVRFVLPDRDQLACLAEGTCQRCGPARAGPCEADLENEQLVEGQTAASLLPFVERPRPVERDERIRAQRQAFTGLQLSRKRIRNVAREDECALDEAAQPLRRHLLARGVDGSEVRGRRDAVQVIGAHLEAVALELTAQPHARPRLQPLGEPGLVEPDCPDLAALVRDPCVDDREVAPGPSHGDAPDLSRDRRPYAAGDRCHIQA